MMWSALKKNNSWYINYFQLKFKKEIRRKGLQWILETPQLKDIVLHH